MKILTVVQLGFKLISLPLIFLFVKQSEDLLQFTLISSVTSLMAGIVVFIYLIKKDKVSIRFLSIQRVYNYWKQSIPFFLSNSIGIIKQQSTTIIIGFFFNMSDVAIFDLANKIISMPIFFLNNIIGALFPKVASEQNIRYIKKVMGLILLVSLLTMLSIIFIGKSFILWFAGVEFFNSYPIAVLLSFSIPSWLFVGSIISFIYVPNYKFKYVTYNQFLSSLIYFSVMAVGIVYFKSIYVVAFSVMFASLFEIVYNVYIVRKNNLL